MIQRRPIDETYECPVCHAAVLSRPQGDPDLLVCENEACARSFPVLDGVPVLLCEERSLFNFADFRSGSSTTVDLGPQAESATVRLRRAMKHLIPDKSYSVADFTAKDAVQRITRGNPHARILVIGAGEDPIDPDSNACLVYSDVAWGAFTDVIADGHDLPFPPSSFDGVVAAAVMEHVLDPWLVSNEVWRVLRPGGAVYASTPFMQQVHMGRYDFHRFTPVAHRRLWRWFDEEEGGIANGPAMALAWSVEYFLRALFRSSRLQSVACYSVRFLTAPLLRMDRFVCRRRAAFDGASGHYFYGTKRLTPLGDREIVNEYPGAQ